MTGSGGRHALDVYSWGSCFTRLLTGVLPIDQRFAPGGSRRFAPEDPRGGPAKAEHAAGHAGGAHNRIGPTQARGSALRRELRGARLDTMRPRKDPARRYGSPRSWRRTSAATSGTSRCWRTRLRGAYRARKFVRRHRLGVGAALVMWRAWLRAPSARLSACRERARRTPRLPGAQTKGKVVEFMKPIQGIESERSTREQHHRSRLLDKSAGNIHEQLSDEPEVRAELAEIMGRCTSSSASTLRRGRCYRKPWISASGCLAPKISRRSAR